MPMSRIIVQQHGLPPYLNYIEAGGQAQGGPADASAGLSKSSDDRGTWAWNPVYSEWQLLHTVRSGDTVWAMTRTYYGEQNLVRVRQIGNVQQNKPILGTQYDQAVPGDVILIPGLSQPGGQAPAPPPPAATPPPGGFEPPPPVAQLPGEIDWGEPPANWPPGWAWPPDQLITQPPEDVVVGAPEAPDVGPGEGPTTGPPATTPVGAITPAAPEKKSWWSPGKIALVGGLGVMTVGLIVWGATRGQKRTTRTTSQRTRRPRRRRPRRRS